MNNFLYQVTTEKTFAEAVEAVQAQTPEHGFRVLYVHDVQALLSGKGFTRDSLKIVEVCNSKYAHDMLQQEILFSLLMPCRISVYVESGKTVINTLRPTALLQMLQKPELSEYVMNVEKILIGIIEASK